jgi:hypothetical protein
MADEPVRPRIMDFLAHQGGFVHVGGIARGAQVPAPSSVRMVLRGLEAAGRLEIRPPGTCPDRLGPATFLRSADRRGNRTRGVAERACPRGRDGRATASQPARARQSGTPACWRGDA